MDDEHDWYGPEVATFGDRLAAAREAADMSQAELARRLGVRLKTLRAWEDDLGEPRANRLSMMAGILNVSMMWLINGQGDGIGSPSEADGLSGSTRSALQELRDLRSEFIAKAEQVGRIEKKLRRLLKEEKHDGNA
jgi:transcriptional regulator with XRE-family HTH domain